MRPAHLHVTVFGLASLLQMTKAHMRQQEPGRAGASARALLRAGGVALSELAEPGFNECTPPVDKIGGSTRAMQMVTYLIGLGCIIAVSNHVKNLRLCLAMLPRMLF